MSHGRFSGSLSPVNLATIFPRFADEDRFAALMHLVDQCKALCLKLGCVNFHLTSLSDQACIASKVSHTVPTRACLFSPYYSSDRAILDGLITPES
jgi:hypothetical protein